MNKLHSILAEAHVLASDVAWASSGDEHRVAKKVAKSLKRLSAKL